MRIKALLLATQSPLRKTIKFKSPYALINKKIYILGMGNLHVFTRCLFIHKLSYP